MGEENILKHKSRVRKNRDGQNERCVLAEENHLSLGPGAISFLDTNPDDGP